MKDKQEIILNYISNGKKKSEIVRDTGLNWRTVNKYITNYERERERLVNEFGETAIPKIIEDMVTEPKYNSSSRKRRKVTDELISEIQGCLAENADHVANGRRKQQMKKIDIYEYLMSKGYDISYSRVCSIIKEEQNKLKEAYIKQDYAPGDVCEFDWGMVRLEIGGKERNYYLAAFTGAYSNYRYSLLFERENTQSFWSAHSMFFAHIKGSYRQMVYDNMRVAVRRFVGKNEKEATEGLLKLSLYYLFNYRFCNVACGNEKGHVERSVEYIRRKAFCRRSSFASLEEANEHLLSVVESLNNKELSSKKGKNPAQLLEEERAYLGESLPPFECAELTSSRVDKYSTISLFQNRYSVPDKYVGCMLDIKYYSDRIEVFDGSTMVCTHPRSYERQAWKLNLEHYLITLERKPGALKNSVAFKQTQESLQQLYNRWFSGSESDFIALLIYMKTEELSVDRVLFAVDKIVASGSKTVTSDTIKMVLNSPHQRELKVIYSQGSIERISASQLQQYNSLLLAGRRDV